MKYSIRIARVLVATAVVSYSQIVGAVDADQRVKTPAATRAPDDLTGTWQRDFLAGSFAPRFAPPGGPPGGRPPGAPPGAFPAGGPPPGAPPGGFSGGGPPGAPPSDDVPRLPDGTVIPFRPDALKLYREHMAIPEPAPELLKAGCKPLGTPQNMMGAPTYPIHIVQTPTFITILLEEGWEFRAIYMNGKHPDEMVPSFNGHSIAHWEGKTLVIETVGLRDETLEFIKLPHSPQLRIIERLHRTKPDQLVDVIELDDPVMYSKPFTFTSVFNRTSEEQIEYVCEDRTP